MKLNFFRKFRQPLKSFNRLTILAAVVGFVILFAGAGCSDTPQYAGAIFLTALVCITLWTNHLAMAPLSKAVDFITLIGYSLYDLFALSVLFILVSIPFPHYSCYTSRAKVSELLVAASESRTTMSERYAQSKSIHDIGKGLVIEKSKRVKEAQVTLDGMIILASDDPPAIVLITPLVVDGQLTWKCSGLPSKHMPALCRQWD